MVNSRYQVLHLVKFQDISLIRVEEVSRSNDCQEPITRSLQLP